MTAIANKNSRKQIEAVIKGIWTRQYSGAAKKLSKTWDGMLGELGDSWSRFMLQIGSSGAFDKLKGLLSSTLGWVERMTSSGKLDQWAKGISDSMSGVMDEFRDFLFGYEVLGDSMGSTIRVPGFLEELPTHLKTAGESIKGLITGFKDIYAAMKPAIDFVGGPGNAALIVLGAITFGPLVASIAMLGAALIGLVAAVSLPVWAILAGVALLGGAVYALIDKWDEFVAYWSTLWTLVGDAFNQSWTTGVLATLSAFNPVTHIMVGMNALFEYFTGIDLSAAGDGIIMSLIDGLMAGFEKLKGYVTNAIAEVAAMLPDWAQGAIGGVGASLAAPGVSSGDVVPDSPGASLGRMATPRANLLDGSGAFKAATTVAPPAGPSSSSSISTSTVDASTINIGSADFPEPIIANQPQNVNAPFNAGGVVVNVQGMTEEQGQAMVQRALANAAAQHAANVRSALND